MNVEEITLTRKSGENNFVSSYPVTRTQNFEPDNFETFFVHGAVQQFSSLLRLFRMSRLLLLYVLTENKKGSLVYESHV